MGEKSKELLTAETKQADTKQAAVALEEPEKEQAEEKLHYSAPVKIGMAAPPDNPPFNNGSNSPGAVNFFQKSYGNFATLRHFNYPIQAKLEVSQPNDIYEQEADRTADEIMSMPEKEMVGENNSAIRNPQPSIQRKPT